MAEEDPRLPRHAAESDDDAPRTRPKRFLTPDWDDWDAESGDSPDTETAPARGGRFALDDDVASTPTPVSAQRQTEPTAGDGRSDAPAPASSGARHAWAAEASEPVEPAVASPAWPSPAGPSATETAVDGWRAIPVEPAPGATHAAETPSLSQKRRREAPALPSTPAPLSPEERREALVARERAARSTAPGTRPEDDWTDAPLPASAVPPPSAGQAPAPLSVQEGDTPEAHRAYTRPSGADEDEDTVWLSRRPTNRAAETTPAPQGSPAEEPPLTTPASAPSFVPSVHAPTEPAPEAGGVAADPSWSAETPGAAAGSSSAESSPSAGEVPPSAEPEEHTVRRRWFTRRPVQIGAAALVVVIALVVGAVVWLNRGTTPTASENTQSAQSLVADLVTADQLTGVGSGQWTEDKTETTVTQDSPTPLCYVASPDLPTPTAQIQRRLTASGATLLHRITQYGSSADAGRVYSQRLTQLGGCSNIPVYLDSGATVANLGDSAVGITAVIQDQSAQFHTLLLVRTGSMVLTYDVAQAGSAVPYEKLLAVAAETVKAVCAMAGGGCSAVPTFAVGVPPTSSVPGWLTVSDLPRITTGMGRWNATAPKDTVTSAGSACENVTLATVAGPTDRKQRTYLLTEDTKVPKDFGLDEIVFDFDTPDAASGFASQLQSAINDCPSRTATAKLGNQGTVDAQGANGEHVTGFWRTVTQSTNATTTFVFRVGVAAVGTRVVYLLATPSSTFDFTDADWGTITARAGQRATQTG